MALILPGLIGFVLLANTAAMADDWQAMKLRGNVFTNNGGDWVRLNRGDVVSDDRVIRTLRSGRVEFRRGAETIEIGGATQISIHDRAGQRYTTVRQDYGTVEVEAEHKQVRHFSVVTPVLAAIVKGTRFRVEYDEGSGASVKVLRGLVEVQDTLHGLKVDVRPGQEADVSAASALSVAGDGVLDPVTTMNGEPVDAGDSGGGLLSLLLGGDSGNGSNGTSLDSTLNTVTSGSGDAIGTTVSTVENTANATINTVANTTSTAVGTVETTTGTVTEAAGSAVQTVTDTVDNTVQETTGTVKNLVGGLLGK